MFILKSQNILTLNWHVEQSVRDKIQVIPEVLRRSISWNSTWENK